MLHPDGIISPSLFISTWRSPPGMWMVALSEYSLKNDATAKTVHALDSDESVYTAQRSQIPISIFLTLITCSI